MEDFDPLSFFSPSKPKKDHHEDSHKDLLLETPPSKDVNKLEYEFDGPCPIHILDLPTLGNKPPAEVLNVILKLLSPNKVVNFQRTEEDIVNNNSIKNIFEEKKLEDLEVETAISWLKTHSSRFWDKHELASVPSMADTLKVLFHTQYNAYMTGIISSDLAWMNENDRSIIVKEASLRLSENCGRTAQPEILRLITFPNLSKYFSGGNYIKLKEPSLTNDNLGLKTWGASLKLSERLLNNHKYLVEPVLELGSGTGLVGMMSSILGFKTVLTDLADILPNLKLNLELNRINSNSFELDWNDPIEFQTKFGKNSFKTILVSDPVYSSNHSQLISNILSRFLENSSEARILIEIPLRPQFENERSELWELLSHNFKEIESSIETGQDDFGEMDYLFKMFVRNI